MKGIKFFAEMPECRPSKNKSKKFPEAFTRANLAQMAGEGGKCNCIAQVGTDYAVGSVTDTPNSGVCTIDPSRDYLATRCVRISEALARKLHPVLFAANLF